jgi:hypothetical protein
MHPMANSSRPRTHRAFFARSSLLFGALVVVAVAGCSSVTTGRSHTVGLISAAGIPITDTPNNALEVVTKATAVPDPLPVTGSGVWYSDLEPALGHSVSSATVPWAAQHRDSNPSGWTLLVELTQAQAEWKDGRLRVAFNVRATLRTRVGNNYLAQTHANCTQAGLVPADQGAPIVFTCMQRIGRDLSGWLGGLDQLR